MSVRQSNRELFPNAAAIVDMFRAVFGDDVKLVYAKENGREIGSNKEPHGCLNSEQWLRLGQFGKVAVKTQKGKRARRK